MKRHHCLVVLSGGLSKVVHKCVMYIALSRENAMFSHMCVNFNSNYCYIQRNVSFQIVFKAYTKRHRKLVQMFFVCQ